jgi:ribosomal protein S14
MIFTKKKNLLDNKKRQHFQKSEIFFECCAILDQAQFSNSMNYFFFKRRLQYAFVTKIRNRCVISGLSRAVSANLKMSRRTLARKILNGGMTGFYRAVW